MRVIGITGRERVGKTTTAEIAVDVLRVVGVDAKIEGFADRLKIAAARSVGFAGDDLELIEAMDAMKVCGSIVATAEHGQHDVQTATLTGREYLENLGDEIRAIAPAPLIDRVLPATLDRSDCDVLLIHDLRTAREAERVRAYGGEVWKVTRPGVSGRPVTHSTHDVPDGDYTIDNRHGMTWLGAAVRVGLEQSLGGFPR
jgi:hypothetical protein